MVRGYFGKNHVGDLTKIGGTLRKKGYPKILDLNTIPPGKCLIEQLFLFQEDKDPRESTLHEKEKSKFNYVEWYLDRTIRAKSPISKSDPWKMIGVSWSERMALLRKATVKEKVVVRERRFFDGHLNEIVFIF